MKKVTGIFFCLLLMVVFKIDAFSSEGEIEWKEITGGMPAAQFNYITKDAGTGDVYVGTESGAFRSSDGGRRWRQIFTSQGESRGVNYIYIGPKGDIYLATKNGIYKSRDGGRNFKRVFKGKNADENNVFCISSAGGRLYAGGAGGVFFSSNNGRSWRKGLSNQVNFAVRDIALRAHSPLSVYLATDRGLYRADADLSHADRIFVSDMPAEDGSSSDEDGLDEPNLILSRLAFGRQGAVYLATTRGIFISRDEGRNWSKFNDIGLLDKDINQVLPSGVSARRLYAATEKGVFEYLPGEDRWREAYLGLRRASAKHIIFGSGDESSLLLAADDGVYKGIYRENAFAEKDEAGRIISNFEDEPSIYEVQQAAIRYAEVGPEKIKGWRRGASFRSLLPDFSIDYDKTINYYGSKDRYSVGPADWGLGISWDLADLIWNPYQKDIDVRSRLMVQLRDDLLDQVTRLYFERRRLQIEMLTEPAKLPKKQAENQLRLQELTAGIDALTGGWFSHQIAERRHRID